MPLQKQAIEMNFGKGVDTKTDPNQVQLGNMLTLENAVFLKGGLLTKRNGFQALPKLPDTTSRYATSHNGNLIALGDALQAYSGDIKQWLPKGKYQDVKIETDALVRNTSSQLTVDTAISLNGASCTVYQDANGSSYYTVADALTGELITAATALPTGATLPRVALLGNYFIVTYVIQISVAYKIQFIAVPQYSPFSAQSPQDLAFDLKSLTAGYDIVVNGSKMYIAFYSSFGGDSIKVGALNSNLLASTDSVITGAHGDLISIAVDPDYGQLWVNYWQASDSNAYAALFDFMLTPNVTTGTQVLTNRPLNHLTSVSYKGTLSMFYQVTNYYDNTAPSTSPRTDYILTNKMTNALTPTTATVMLRSVGLGSKAYILNNHIYMLVNYGGKFQPSYFIVTDTGQVVGKIAYSNGIQYAYSYILPQVTVVGQTATFGYLFKDLLTSVNKTISPNSVAGIYSQTGINLATVIYNSGNISTVEIGGALRITGGIPWMYDGTVPVEDGFFVYPEDPSFTSSTSGTPMLTAQQYYYQITYEWTDSNGNIQRSAPSVPLSVNLSATSSVTLKVPTLRLTYKVPPNNVRIVIYRWSVAQQTFYQITSVPNPLANDTSVDSITYVDNASDSSIIGNLILYTTGGVIENIQAPSTTASALYKSRLFSVDAENPNLLWYSKQVIQNTSVDMSDLQTIYVPPTSGSQGSTGIITALSAMDDKLIIFKANAIYYLVGVGPDATGANNDFSDINFITSTVGSINIKSIVFTPNGLMFQSDKGIWLLGRNLSTEYLGAAVENYTSSPVTSSVNIPGTNQVRFMLASGITLMYDYYFQQWGTFTNIPSVASSLYQNKHTFINKFGEVFQEAAGFYLDGTKPVNLKFTTAWVKLANIQGYQRIYFFLMLAQYASPHHLHFGISYDYNPSIVQDILVNPDNSTGAYGSDPVYGDESPYGGGDMGLVEQWRLFPQRQKCESFQITMQEFFDETQGLAAGAGLSITGLNLVIGVKKGYNAMNGGNSVG